MSEHRNWASELDAIPRGVVSPIRPGTPDERPRGLVYQRLYEWLSYPAEPPMEKYRDNPGDPEEAPKERPAFWWTDRSVGFRAKVLVNPLGGELRIQDRKFAAWLLGSGGTEEEYLAAIAHRVIEWEFVVIDEDGTRSEVPSPSVGGWERFLDLPADAYVWLTTIAIRDAHRPKALTSTKSAGSGDSTTQTKIDPALDAPDSLPTPLDSDLPI